MRIPAEAKEFDIHAANVERDDVFGWLLFAIYTDTALKDVLSFERAEGRDDLRFTEATCPRIGVRKPDSLKGRAGASSPSSLQREGALPGASSARAYGTVGAGWRNASLPIVLIDALHLRTGGIRWP